MVKRKEIFLFLILILLGIFFIYIYLYIKQAQKDIFTRVETNKIQQISYLFKNIEKDLMKNSEIIDADSLTLFLSDEETRQEYEDRLSLLITPSIKYLYLLSKDSKERFRFVLDASQTDKARFYQKFDVINEKYDLLYTTKSEQVIRQKKVENLFLTYLYPIKSNGKVIAVLSVDITTQIKDVVLKLIKPLETFFIVLIIIVFLIIMMSIMQTFHYFMTRKKIFTDPLTSLFNRNYLEEISPMLNLKHYSVAMLDLDRFKIINDTYGHKTGDFILSQSAKIFKSSIRDSDILIRYGGEEFLLFVYTRKEPNSVTKICERIRKNLNDYSFKYDGHDIGMQISIGVHENPSLEKNLQEVIKIADKMLYVAKSEGRNRVIYYNEISQNTPLQKAKDINFVKRALDDDRVTCYYQPIFSHINNSILKYEALVRIIDVNGDIIPPAFFLNELKHTNIHYKLTQRILSTVFKKFEDTTESVSININFSDLINSDIESTIFNTLSNNSDLASRVTFEILESDEINNVTLFKEKIDFLHSMGVKVSIDDFGSGYSNFRTILDVEANYLKIDGSLIKNIDKNEKDFKIVKSILHFAKEAHMQIIAEFVHSQEVYDKLIDLEVDYLQGYYISKPMSTLIKSDELFKKDF